MHQVVVKKTPNPNLHDGRLRVAVTWCEARRYIQKPDLVVLVLLWFGDNKRHHRFVFRLCAPLVRRHHPPPPTRVAGPISRDESSFPGVPLVGGVVLHYRWRNDINGGRRRGGRHWGSTMTAAVLCISVRCADHDGDGEVTRRERGGADQELMGQIGEGRGGEGARRWLGSNLPRRFIYAYKGTRLVISH